MRHFNASINSERKLFLFVFIFLYPIVPLNYYIIGSVNVLNSISLILFIWFLFKDKITLFRIRKANAFFWLYMMVFAMQTFISAGVLKGMGYVLSYLFVCIVIITHVQTKAEFTKIIDYFIYGSCILSFLGSNNLNSCFFWQKKTEILKSKVWR
jgi:hypothetical protein